jgi:hypothetical protein
MQSVQEQSISLEQQINKIFNELVLKWREVEGTKKAMCILLAERMEEYYKTTGQEEKIKYISIQIKDKLRENGIDSTADNVDHYLDERFKRGYNQDKPNRTSTELIYNRHDLAEVSVANPMQLSKEECWWYLELYKKMETHAKAIEQAMDVRKIAKNVNSDGSLPKKHFDKVTTERPEPLEGRAYEVMEREVIPAAEALLSTLVETSKKIKEFPPLTEEDDKELAEGLSHFGKGILTVITKFMDPFKDLKYATCIPKWWSAVKNFFHHGKHAAAVMDAIHSHKRTRDKTIKLNGIPCPHNCGYYISVPDKMKIPDSQEYTLNPKLTGSQLSLIMEHLIEKHRFEIPLTETVIQTVRRLLPQLKIQEFKTIVQVAIERDFTREQTGDRIFELLELALEFSRAIPAFAKLCEWRIKSVDPRVATRRIDAHEPLSFWA